MSNFKLFLLSIHQLRQGNEKVAHEIAEGITSDSFNFDDELDKMREKEIDKG